MQEILTEEMKKKLDNYEKVMTKNHELESNNILLNKKLKERERMYVETNKIKNEKIKELEEKLYDKNVMQTSIFDE